MVEEISDVELVVGEAVVLGRNVRALRTEVTKLLQASEIECSKLDIECSKLYLKKN